MRSVILASLLVLVVATGTSLRNPLFNPSFVQPSGVRVAPLVGEEKFAPTAEAATEQPPATQPLPAAPAAPAAPQAPPAGSAPSAAPSIPEPPIIDIEENIKAVAVLKGDNPSASGVVHFSQSTRGGPLTVDGTFTGLPQGKPLGIHVHEFGDISAGCVEAKLGLHFNPFRSPHGAPSSNVTLKHLGDLGNVENGKLSVTISDLPLMGPFSIIGRGLVLHAETDDLGTAPTLDSMMKGSSNGMLLCGVIGIESNIKRGPMPEDASAKPPLSTAAAPSGAPGFVQPTAISGEQAFPSAPIKSDVPASTLVKTYMRQP